MKPDDHYVRYRPDGELVYCYDVNKYSKRLEKEFGVKEGAKPYKIIRRGEHHDTAEDD